MAPLDEFVGHLNDAFSDRNVVFKSYGFFNFEVLKIDFLSVVRLHLSHTLVQHACHVEHAVAHFFGGSLVSVFPKLIM